MRYSFYDSSEYKRKQSEITKRKQAEGVYDHLVKRERRTCTRQGCEQVFQVKPSDSKVYCGKSCAALVNNKGRGSRSIEVRKKISASLKGHPNPFKGRIKIPHIAVECGNANCGKRFFQKRWMKKRFCSNQCAMRVIGGSPTSPKAARGKAGIRKDISDTLYFYSRWEANVARLFSYLGIRWVFQPKTFDIGSQMYTPDFYLPEEDTYIEVKNFMWKYSKERDEKFRTLYPTLKLKLILKDEYLELERKYSAFIVSWEYRNSRFES
ncbi:MAG: hypothetical protein Q8Q38_00235 [bacterium]|nr:hypothetical protein [bacterium]